MNKHDVPMARMQAFDAGELRRALGCFATGVTVITSVGQDGELLGLTANSFNSVSIAPPLVLFSLDRKAYSLRGFLSAGNFAVNVLNEQQRALSNDFAVALGDKWQDREYHLTASGCPCFPDSLAVLDCGVRYTYQGGDHVIFVGEVLALCCDPGKRPLIYYQGGYSILEREEAR